MVSCIVLMTGLPGTGKSTVARALARRVEGVVLDKDLIRTALFPEPLIEYSRRQDDFCMHVLLQTAEYLIAHAGVPFVFIDGRPAMIRAQRDEVAAAAARTRCVMAVIHTTCSEIVAEQRLQNEHVAKNRTLQLYRELRAKAEPITRPHLEVNTEQALDVVVEQCTAYLAEVTSRTQITPAP